MKVISQRTYSSNLSGETFKKPSLTVPDDSYTIRDLLTRYTNGIMPPVAKQAIYDDSVTFEDMPIHSMNSMDLVDVQEQINSIEMAISHRKSVIEAEKRKQAADMKAAERKEWLRQHEESKAKGEPINWKPKAEESEKV